MSLTPTDTWNARLLLLADGLAEDRRAGFPLGAPDVDGWLRRIGIGWEELFDWMIRKAIDDLETAARATPDGSRLLDRIHRIQRTVPQFSELMITLDLAAELHGTQDTRVLARLEGELQAAANGGARPIVLADLLWLWADARAATVSFAMRGNMARIEVEV